MARDTVCSWLPSSYLFLLIAIEKLGPINSVWSFFITLTRIAEYRSIRVSLSVSVAGEICVADEDIVSIHHLHLSLRSSAQVMINNQTAFQTRQILSQLILIECPVTRTAPNWAGLWSFNSSHVSHRVFFAQQVHP